MQQIVDKNLTYDETINLSKVLGSEVITKRGLVMGKVKQARMHPKTFALEGIYVSGFLKKDIYIDKHYITNMSKDSVLLSIEPSILLKGKDVLMYDGEKLGKVKDVVRVKQTNSITGIVVKPRLKKAFEIKATSIKSFGNATIILKEGYKKHG